MPTILITGTNRGLGLEMVRQYADAGWRVLACCRVPSKAEKLQALCISHGDAIEMYQLDVTDFDNIDQLADELSDTPIDVLLNNAGVFGPKVSEGNDLRQSFGSIDYDIWAGVLHTNTFAPMKMAEAFIGHVAASGQKKIAVISSVIGSIGAADGQFYAYGTSKAAVSKAFANLAKDVADKEVAVGVFCPGWVPTEMGGPQADVAIEDSIRGLRARIDELDLNTPLTFRRYNNDLLPW